MGKEKSQRDIKKNPMKAITSCKFYGHILEICEIYQINYLTHLTDNYVYMYSLICSIIYMWLYFVGFTLIYAYRNMGTQIIRFLSLYLYIVMQEKEKDISDLLLWAIFANRRELAEICWLRTDDHLRKFPDVKTCKVM